VGSRAGLGRCGKSRIRSPDLPARSESLYRLRYRGPTFNFIFYKYWHWAACSLNGRRKAGRSSYKGRSAFRKLLHEDRQLDKHGVANSSSCITNNCQSAKNAHISEISPTCESPTVQCGNLPLSQ
jgi:hypothetical protein